MDTKTSGLVETMPGYNNLSNRNIPKTLLYYFLITQLVSALDFGFSKLFDDSVRTFLRFFTILEACTFNVIILASIYIDLPLYNDPSWLLMPFLEYSLNCTVLICCKKYNIYDFLCNISEYCKLTKKDTFILYFISIIQCIVINSLKTIFLVMIKDTKIEPYLNQLPWFYYLFINYYNFLLDLVLVAQIVIIYYIYSSMKHLRLTLTSSGKKLSFVLFRYKNIVDICEKIRPLFDASVRIF